MSGQREGQGRTRTFKHGWEACSIKHVNADKIEAEVTALIADLVARPEMVERAVCEANEANEANRGPLAQRERTIRAQLKGLDAKAGNLLAVLEASGAEKLVLVRDRLAAIEQRRATFSAELAVVTEQFREARRNVIDRDRISGALADLRLLYEVTTPAERGDLVRLLFKSLRFQGRTSPWKRSCWTAMLSYIETRRVRYFRRLSSPNPTVHKLSDCGTPSGDMAENASSP